MTMPNQLPSLFQNPHSPVLSTSMPSCLSSMRTICMTVRASTPTLTTSSLPLPGLSRTKDTIDCTFMAGFGGGPFRRSVRTLSIGYIDPSIFFEMLVVFTELPFNGWRMLAYASFFDPTTHFDRSERPCFSDS